MKSYFLILSFVFAFCNISISQAPVDIKDANFMKAQDLKVKLGLNLNNSLYLEEILNRHNLKLREIVMDSRGSNLSFGEQYAVLKAERDKELRALLDDQQMKLFILLEKSDLQDIKDYYINLDQSLSQNEEFTQYLSVYYRNNQSPTIQKHKEQLNQKVSPADSMELIELRIAFNEILDDALMHAADNSINIGDLKLGKVIKTLGKDNPGYTDTWNRIKKLSRRYSKVIKEEYSQIDYYTKDWNNGIKSILRDYMNEEKTAVENQMYFTLTQFGISENVNRYVFLLYEENDINTYFELKSKVQKLLIKISS